MDLVLNKNSQIVSNGRIYQYKDINAAVSKIQNSIPQYARRVAVCMNHDEKYLYSILALINRHITYIPILSSDPQDRIEYILRDCDVDTVIVNAEHSSKFTNINTIVVEEILEGEIRATIENMDDIANDIIYILYTSGTTGRPKGVAVTYENINAFLEGITEVIELNENTVMLYHTSYTFDINFLESVAILVTGGTVIVADESEYMNVKRIISLIKKNCVNTLQMTPSKFYLLLKYDPELGFLEHVNKVLIGGEAFPKHLLKLLQAKKSTINRKLRIYNMYGPTETTIWSAVRELTDVEKVDVGTPIKNADIYIVDDECNVLGNQEEGEIFITGKVVGKGYINNEELTSEKFVNLSVAPNQVVYGFLTGDKGCINENGMIECYSRKDNQIKFNGVRIELEEIESVVQEYIKGGRCAVIKVDYADNSDLVVCCNHKDINVNELRQYMQIKLPQYMVPSIVCYVEKIPYTQSSKLDRKKLVEMYMNGDMMLQISNTKDDVDSVEDEVRAELVDIIITALKNKISHISLEDNLKELGINSINYIEIIVTAESSFGIEFDEDNLVLSEDITFKELLEYVKSKIDEK